MGEANNGDIVKNWRRYHMRFRPNCARQKRLRRATGTWPTDRTAWLEWVAFRLYRPMALVSLNRLVTPPQSCQRSGEVVKRQSTLQQRPLSQSSRKAVGLKKALIESGLCTQLVLVRRRRHLRFFHALPIRVLVRSHRGC